MSTRSLGWSRLVLAVVIGLSWPAAAWAAAAPSQPPSRTGLETTLDAVRINGGQYATNDPNVTVSVAPPPSAAAAMRLSNDSAAWVQVPYQASVAWSLVNPAGGGIDSDGHKPVYVQYGLDGAWVDAGVAWIYLDRVAPAGPVSLEGGAESMASWKFGLSSPTDELSGMGAYRMSLDGVRWSDWTAGLASNDWRTIDYGGSWSLGTRVIFVQMRDLAGNESVVYSDSIELIQPPLNPDEGTLPVRFEFPRQAVTGSLFTIKPIFPAGFTMPTNAWCNWYLHWGDDESLYGPPNENYGELAFERKASAGGCRDWTFTLPYNAGRRFNLQFVLLTKTAAQEDDWGAGTALYANQTWKVLEFTAAIGTTDRHIRQSTIPVVYLLPDSTLTQQGDPVTYRLYASGGLTIPQTGSFWTYPTKCYLNPQWSQQGGSSFTYTPNCDGNWVTGWTGTYKGGFMRTQYDPVVDGKPPVVGYPVVKLNRASVGSSAPITVSYTGRDTASGVYQFQLQRSVNGGAWTNVTLPSRLTQTVKTSLSLTAATRYRVRARDKVGNWSAWRYGPTIKGYAFQDTYKYIRWAGSWSVQSSSAWFGGTARATTQPAATATFNFSGRSVGWVARKGPDRGLVRIWVDGAPAGTVDLRAPTVGFRSVQFATTWAASGTHSLRIENLGTDGSPGVNVDAFLVVK
jgi:hypothetical protein